MARSWPRHIAHEERGIKLVKQVCQRLKTPTRHRDLALAACQYHTHCHRALDLRGKTILKLFNATDALRRPERFEAFLQACEADARGRLGFEDRNYPQANYLSQGLAVVQGVSAAQFADRKLIGKDLGAAISAERIRLLEALRPD